MRTLSICICLFLISSHSISAQRQNLTVKSPDGKITVQLSLTDKISYTIRHENDVLLAPSSLALELSTGRVLGANPSLRGSKIETVNRTITTPFYKRASVNDNYNELQLTFKDNYKILFRAYNDGVAYRFVTSLKDDVQVVREEASFNFENDYKAFVPYVNKPDSATIEEQLWNSFENTYTHVGLRAIDPARLIFLPVLVDSKNGKKLCITEADLENYPGMYLMNKNGTTSLTAYHAQYPREMKKGGHNELQEIVTSRESFIAKSAGTRSFPWRVFVVADSDKKLTDNDLVYKLASPSRIGETAEQLSWIKPGKVAWDWWNDWNIYNVDFEAGINTQTYKYYIDFASANKLEYVILDEGWAVNLKADLMQVIEEIDLKEIVEYAKSKNVGIILWAGYNAFNKDIEGVCRHYAEMGVKGFKVDFMDRDDQEMVNFYYRAAEVAAKYKLLLDFHGAYKPTGLNRTYPNVINFEGVHGLEQMKWSAPSVDQVTYDVSIPFIRMVAGPLDYTQGAMRNATKRNYRPINDEPMSQGTRCRQLAQYVIFEAPLTMLCDAPSNYMDEEECAKFITDVPTTWDNTIALDGKVAQYVAIARQKGDSWYVGALTNWDKRNLELDLSFLPSGNYTVEIFKDGVNAHRVARDYKKETVNLDPSRKLSVVMASGGGFVAKISPR